MSSILNSFNAIILAVMLLFPSLLLAEGGAFPTGTQIRVPRGWQSIEKLQAGDKVIGIKDDGKIVEIKIKRIVKIKATLITIKTNAGVIDVPAEDAIAMAGGGYCEIRDLKLGHEIQYLKGTKVKTAQVLSIREKRGKTVEIYGLTVEHPNNFIANNLVVHDRE